MKTKKHLSALLSLVMMLGTAAVVPVTASAGVAENAAILNSLHVGDVVYKDQIFNFSGDYSFINYFHSATDTTPYAYENTNAPFTVSVGGRHDYYIIRSVSGSPGTEWKGMYMSDGNIALDLIGCYSIMYAVLNGQKVEMGEADPGPAMYCTYYQKLKPGDYELYFESPYGDKLGGTFRGFDVPMSLQFDAPSIKFTLNEYSNLSIDFTNGNFVISKTAYPYDVAPTATYEQLGEDYPADDVNVHGASLWRVNVEPGTYAATELNVSVNGKTAGAPIVNMDGFTGSVVFGVVLNGVKNDINSFEVLVNGSPVEIE